MSMLAFRSCITVVPATITFQTLLNFDIHVIISNIPFELKHYTYKVDFLCTFFLIRECVLLATKLCSTNTLNAIGHIVWFSISYANFSEIKGPIVFFMIIM